MELRTCGLIKPDNQHKTLNFFWVCTIGLLMITTTCEDKTIKSWCRAFSKVSSWPPNTYQASATSFPSRLRPCINADFCVLNFQNNKINPEPWDSLPSHQSHAVQASNAITQWALFRPASGLEVSLNNVSFIEYFMLTTTNWKAASRRILAITWKDGASPITLSSYSRLQEWWHSHDFLFIQGAKLLKVQNTCFQVPHHY